MTDLLPRSILEGVDGFELCVPREPFHMFADGSFDRSVGTLIPIRFADGQCTARIVSARYEDGDPFLTVVIEDE